MPPRSRSTLIGGLVLALAVAYAAWCLHAYRDFVHDDAFITLRYVANFLDGHGLVWNPGERVEGYTSFAAVLAIAIPGLLGADLVLAARLVNGLSLVGLAIYAGWFFAGRERRPASAVPGAALVLTFPPLSLWTMGGLEAPLFAMVMAIACGDAARMFRRRDPDPGDWRVALLLGSLALIRPDGAVFGAVAGAFYVTRAIRAGGPAWPPILRFAAAGLALPLLHLAFRLVYYGSVVPNSVIAKTVGQPPVDHLAGGLEYARGFLAAAPFVVAGALLALGVTLARREARMPGLFLVSCAAIYAGLVVKAGGDHMPGHRLLLPVIPLLILALGSLLEAWRGWRSHVVLGVVLAGQLSVSGVPRHQPTDPAAFVGRIVGEYIDASLPDGALVALNTAGSTPYFARDQVFIDMLGLNDERIAARRIIQVTVPWQQMPGHAKGDGDYVLRREPDWIILGPAEGAPARQPWFLSDWEIVQDRRFGEHYRERVIDLDATGHPGFEMHRATRSGRLRLTVFERRDPVN